MGQNYILLTQMLNLKSQVIRGSEIVYIREGLITERLKVLEGDTSETICLEVTISKKV